MMRHLRRMISVIVCIFLLIAVHVLFVCPEAAALIGTKEGDNAKPVVLSDLSGKRVDVTAFFGRKPVILVFWELTSDRAFLNYSLDELLFLRDFYERLHGQYGLEIIGIYTPEEDTAMTEQEMSAVKALLSTHRIPFPILIDEGLQAFQEYGVIALPSTVMISKEGKISFIYPSFPLTARNVLQEEIETLLGIAKPVQKQEAGGEHADAHAGRLYRYALQMYKRQLYEQAISPLGKSLEINQHNPWSQNLMGVIMWRTGNVEGALERFGLAVGEDPANAAAHFNFGLALYGTKRFTEAGAHFKEAISRNPAMAEAQYMTGLILKMEGQDDSAMKAFERARELFLTLPVKEEHADRIRYYRMATLYDLAELYHKKHDDIRAREALKEAVRTAMGIQADRDPDSVLLKKDLMMYE